MGIVLTSFGRALLAPPFRLRRDTIPPHAPSGPFADHPCVRFTRLARNDSVTRRRKFMNPLWGIRVLVGLLSPCAPQSHQHRLPVYLAEDDRMSAYRRVTDRLQITSRLAPAPCPPLGAACFCNR